MQEAKSRSVEFEEDFRPVIEQLAVKVHEVWTQERRAAGWVYGRRRNDARKEHPCLLEFADLAEEEKEVDRSTARAVLHGLMGLGYAVTRAGSDPLPGGEGSLAELDEQLISQGPLSADALQTRWQQFRNIPNCPAAIYLKLGELILRQSEPILAYDILDRGIRALRSKTASGPEQPHLLLRLKQQLALALAQSEASERACDLLNQLRDQGGDTPETLGLMGRVYKDLSSQATTETKRHELLTVALHRYRRGFETAEANYRASTAQSHAGDAYYCGINAAALEAVRGDLAAARALAGRVRKICLAQFKAASPTTDGAGYWLLATLGECELICGHFAEAQKWYRAAARKSGGSWRELASTRRQMRLLTKTLGQKTDEWDGLFPKMGVVVFAPALSWTMGDLATADLNDGLRQELLRNIKEVGAIAGYLWGLSPSEVILGEALLDLGAEVHVFLPCPRKHCRQLLAAQPDWVSRLDELLPRLTSLSEDAETTDSEHEVRVRFAGLRAYGSGWLRASRLASDLHMWELAEVPSGRGVKHKGFALRARPDLSSSWKTNPARVTVGRRQALFKSVTPAIRSKKAANSGCEILAMLFADVKGYATLDDAALWQFHHHFMPALARVVRPLGRRILVCETAGDGLFLVFSEIEVALQTALSLIDRVARTSWRTAGLPFEPSIRISLDAGPVHVFRSPITLRPEVCGKYVNRAARIELVTPPNQVYASEAIASLYVATGGRAFRFEYVGQTQLPKGFGFAPLYCVRRNPNKSSYSM